MANLFEVVILENPTKAEAEAGQLPKLVLGPIMVIAKDNQSAGVTAVMKHKDTITCDMSRAEVLVRPFA